MHEIAEFLARHPPFDALASDELEAISAQAEIEYFAAGALITAQGASLDAVRVVRRGEVEILDDDRPIDLLGPGEVFGYAAMLSGLPSSVGARAVEDTLTYRFDQALVAGVFARPEGVRFVVRELDALDARRTDQPRLDDPSQRPVGSLIDRPAVVCRPDTSIRAAAQQMAETGVSSTIVTLADGTIGLMTDRDLRTRVVAEGRSYDEPVANVMSAPAYTVTHDRLGSEVLLEMLDRGVRHFPVIGAGGGVIGVVSDKELLAVETRTPFHLRSAISRAQTTAAVVDIVRRLPATFVALADARVATRTIGTTVSVVVDAAARRLIELAVEDAGPEPARFSWIALGAHARRELAPSSDLDNAMSWCGADDDVAVHRYVRGVAHGVAEALNEAGQGEDTHGAVAYRPLFSRSLDAWREVIRSWIAHPEQEKALILVSLMADARPVWGANEGAALVDVFRDAHANPELLRGLARMALAHRPPTGFLRNIVVEHSGEHRGQLDIKHGGLLPIVDLARYAGIAAGVAGSATRERLAASAAAGTLTESQARVLLEAFELVSRLRLEHQVAQLRAGAQPDDYLVASSLSSLTRTYLKDAFRAIAHVQRGLIADLDLRLR